MKQVSKPNSTKVYTLMTMSLDPFKHVASRFILN